MTETVPRTEPFVLAERDGDILWLTLNRPERLNSVHLRMRDELWMMLSMIRDDPTVAVVVLRAAGDRAFSAGADITEFGTAPSYIQARDARQQRDLWGVMSRLPVPLIAAIHGFAFGAGLEMSLYCDLRISSDDATFALPEVSLGYIPSAGGTQTLPRHIRLGDALRMATGGEPVDASEAYEMGLVHQVVPREDLERTALEWANQLSKRDSLALRSTKLAVIEGLELPLSEGLALERRLASVVAERANES